MASDTIPTPAPGVAGADSPRQVAVIAIHGVGRHAPGSSAEAIATLLASIDRADNSHAYQHLPKGPRRCSGFDIDSIEVPLAAVATEHVPAQPKRGLLSRIWSVFDERRGFLDQQRRLSARRPAKQDAAQRHASQQHSAEQQHHEAPQDKRFDYKYMLMQLAEYQAEPERTFSTKRFVSRRFSPIPGDPVPPPPTHIYDAHYSDLSKNESSIVGFFYAFFQLLFHLAALGLMGVYWAEAENSEPGPGGWPWRLLSSFHATAVRLLIMFVPLLNLIMLAIGLSAFADKATTKEGAPNDLVLGIIGASIAALFGVVVTLLATRKWRPAPTPFLWSLFPLLGAALSTGLFWTLAKLDHQWAPQVSAPKCLALINWLVLAGLAVFWIAQKLAEMRPGADWVGGILYVLNAGFYFYFLACDPHPASQAATASLLTIQLIFGELVVCWVACLVTELLSYPISEICLYMVGCPGRRARVRAAHRTGRFAFAISASFFLIVVLAIWSGICSYAGKKLHVFDRVDTQFLAAHTIGGTHLRVAIPDACQLVARIDYLRSKADSWQSPTEDSACDATKVLQEPDAQKQPDTPKPVSDYLDGLLLVSVTPGLPIILALIGVSFFLLLWAVAPSVIYEVSPQRTPPSDPHATANAGEWLSRGLDNTAVLIRVLWFAIVPVPLFFGTLNFLVWTKYSGVPAPLKQLLERFNYWILPLMDWLSHVTLPLIQGTGAEVTVSAAAIVAIILKYGGAVLDTLLDVDNYLRTVPVDLTPRARIAERITSLLRYVAAYRDPQGRPYERLVIVAHSLGTLVAADLLRFITGSRANDHDPVLHPDGLHAGETTPAIPIYLMTMGSPLRPLLNRFFPHLYEWVTPMPDNSSRANRLKKAQTAQPDFIPTDSLLPDPGGLCVKGWCNAYRSGDYVGRYLWNIGWLKRNKDVHVAGPAPQHGNPHLSNPATTPAPTQISLIQDASPSTRAEMCIGIGAHTHYWDRNAPDIAHVLAKLIRDPTQIFH